MREKVYGALAKINWEVNDITLLDAMLTYANEDKMKDIYNNLFTNEKFLPLLNNISFNSLTKFCTVLIQSGGLTNNQVKDLSQRLRVVNYKAWSALVVKIDNKKWTKEDVVN